MKNQFKQSLAGLLLVMMITSLLTGCSNTVEYTVTFDSNGGSAIDAQTVKEDGLATKPDDPIKEGFTFVEWQCNEAAYDFDTPVTQNVTLTATYSINEGTEIVLVMLDYQNDQPTGIVEIEKGSSMTEPPIPKKQGYKFCGWYQSDDKFDFTSKLSENITLTAKWEADTNAGASTSKNTTTTTTSLANGTTSNETTQNTDTSATQYDSIVDKYAGRWYLSGYSDVCIDVSKNTNFAAMLIYSHNFTIPQDKTRQNVIYPAKYDSAAITPYETGFTIAYDDWNNDLNEQKVILGSNCIYINNNKFVRAQGTKDRYYDTCYKAALGTWYLDNNPESILKIYTYSNASNIDNSDYFAVDAIRFDLSDFSTNISRCPAVIALADRKENWDKYGISVKDGVLTITNSNGTRTFHKTAIIQNVTGISLNASNVSLALGTTKTVTATVTPSNAYDKTVTWSSSNTAVASVSSSGIITGNSEGEATITATTKDGSYTASCKVTVSVIHVNGVSLNQTTLNMIIGDKSQLTANVSPSDAVNKNVAWSSSDVSIAKVSSAGLVTAVSKGTATITVRTADGGYCATCNVTVKDPPLSVKASIGIETRFSDSVAVKGIFAEVKPSGGSGTYVAYSIKLYYNGTLIGESSSNQIFVTPARNGTYTAEVYVKDSNGNEATGTSTVSISS